MPIGLGADSTDRSSGMMTSKLWFGMLGMALALVACQPADSSSTAPGGGTDLRQEFKNFYAEFHRDSLFQIEHIQFPLQGVSSNPSDHHAGFRWERADWQMHRLFDEASTGFSSQFTWLGDDFVIERIEHRNGQYGMERRFSRLSGQDWYLIYYAALHPL